MKVFYSFLILITCALLLFVDVPQGVYDYRTKVHSDTFNYVSTGAGETTANVTIIKALYDDDTSTFSVSSNTSSDIPVFSSYNAATRDLKIAGLGANITRTLYVDYDVTALSGLIALDTFMDLAPYFWYILLFCFMASAIAYMWVGRG